MQPEPDNYTITLLRHGQSTANAEGRVQGQLDYPLSHTGRDQAAALAEYWHQHGRTFDRCISSTSSRASDTACIICQRLEVPLQLDANWREINLGQISGLTGEEADERFPNRVGSLYEPIGMDGESFMEVYARAGLNVQNLVRMSPGRILIVSHGGLLRWTLTHMLGIAPQANWQMPGFRFRNTSYADLIFNPQHNQWHLLGLNHRPHWPEE